MTGKQEKNLKPLTLHEIGGSRLLARSYVGPRRRGVGASTENRLDATCEVAILGAWWGSVGRIGDPCS